MREKAIRVGGLVMTLIYASAIAWTYSRQPASVAQLTGGLAAQVGAYRIDQRSFADGLAFFKRDQFEEARSAFSRADPAERDARTQFYLAYTCYRQGWGRLYNDDALFAAGLTYVEKAIALAPSGRLVLDDAGLQMRSPDELRAELQAGLERDLSDLNPMRVLRQRK
ncbi:MAG: hypothetical protein H0W08_26830 [Acidobacteria bacterium]|nr:hypothetical protein [Acidobacteriota bacterium]